MNSRNLKWLAALVLGWVLICPRLSYAQTNTSTTKWEKEVSAFEASDKTNFPPIDAILFLGSSSIRKWTNVVHDFPDLKVINRGFGGSQIDDSVALVDRLVLPYKPKLIVFYAGDNDIGAKKSPEKVAADFKALVEKVHASLPATRIAFVSIKPSLKRWNLVEQIKVANQLIEEYTKTDKRLDYINVFNAMLGEDGKPRPELFVADGLHMTPKGYELWTSLIRPHLN
jgi:lysophospholipase L1-like esterase